MTDPFTTTRTTRKVGLGLPLLRLAAEQTGGSLTIESAPGVGTTVTAVFHTGHIDCPPLGDMALTVALLVQGAPEVEVTYTRESGRGSFTFDTRQVRQILGPGDLSGRAGGVLLDSGLPGGAGGRPVGQRPEPVNNAPMRM